MHLGMTVLTLGVWGICFISAAAKRFIWPWRCEHCGWHEPDFRSPEERRAGKEKTAPRAGDSGSLRRAKNGDIIPNSEFPQREGK